jgi:hypothetical protein
MATTAPTKPTRGGLITQGANQVAWTGGAPTGSHGAKPGPVSLSAYRPEDYKTAYRIEEMAEKPLPEDKRIGRAGDKKCNVSLVEWVTEVKAHMDKFGLDSVFYVRKNTTATTPFVDLLTDWNYMSNAEVTTWLAQETFDGYDNANLRMSGTFLRGSVTTEMWRALEPVIKKRIEGPRIFVAVVRAHQHVGASAVRELLLEIQKLKIYNEPAENVEDLSTKIYVIASKIVGMVIATDVPKDLAEVCASCFLKTKTLAFNIRATKIHQDASDGTIDWEEVLTQAVDAYHSLSKGVSSSQWEASQDKREDPEIKALKAEIKAEFQTLKHKWKGNSGKDKDDPNDTSTNDRHKNITCHTCHKKGHISRNCPDKSKDKGEKSKGKKSTKDSTKTSNAAYKEAPKDGEAQTKEINGEKCSWCGKCNRWTHGEGKIHLTSEHKTAEDHKKEKEASAPQGRVALDDNSFHGRGLALCQGF